MAAEAALAGGDPWAAADLAAAALAAEPYDEAALRLLMAAYAATGRTALALRSYAETAARLADDLGVDPSPESQRAHVALLRAEPAEPPPPVAAPTLPGRAADLAALDASLGAGAALVLVEGEPGIGKTRLLDTWCAGLNSATVLRAAGDELTGNLPFQPVFDALAAHDLPLTGDAALLGPLIGAGGEPGPTTLALLTGGPTAGQTLLVAALDAVVGQLAAAGPVVLVLDDAQWADRATLGWLHHVVRRHAARPLLVVVARRAGAGDTPIRAARTITLGPLDAVACAAIVGEEPGSARAVWLHERSGGHPLFLIELARGGAGVPDSIRAAVAERCDECGPAAATTLRAAAVLGPVVDLDLLATVRGAPVTDLLDHLESGARHGLLVERGPVFAFRHQLLRDAVEAGTGEGRATVLHRLAARALAGRARHDPLEVAYHARLGGDPALAATSLARAAEECLRRYDYAEARSLLDEAIALDDRPDLRVRRGRALLLLGDVPGALAAAGGGDDARAYELAAMAHYAARSFAAALASATEALARAGDDDAELRANCLGIAGRVQHATGNLAAARELHERALLEAPASVRPLIEMWLGHLRLHMGRYGPAADVVERSGDDGATPLVGYPFVAVTRHFVLGMARAMQGHPAAALTELATAGEAGRRENVRRYDGLVSNVRGWVLRNVGEFDRADEANEEAYEQAHASGLSEPVAHSLLDLADGRLRAGDPAGARGLLDRLTTEAADDYSFRWRADLRARLLAGRVALAGGDVDGALGAAEDIHRRAAALDVDRYAVQADLLAALARAAAGDGGDPAALDPLVRRLGAVAPLEAWWLTAELADAFDADPWRRLAADRAAALVGNAGPYADTLRRIVAARLG